jgi:GNAT superfamily N-acetyltransferase
MLHRAFARLGEMGLNCTCVDQSAAVTRSRATRGDCYVAVCDGRIVGTMTLYAPDRDSPCELYRRGEIASMRQFGVEPAWQARGIGTLLLAFADHWAATRGYAELALDTPQPAAHLIAFYRGHGFRIVDFMRFDGKRYDSAILSKPAVAARTLATWSQRLELPRRQIARAA